MPMVQLELDAMVGGAKAARKGRNCHPAQAKEEGAAESEAAAVNPKWGRWNPSSHQQVLDRSPASAHLAVSHRLPALVLARLL